MDSIHPASTLAPPLPPFAVRRPYLVERLEAAVHRKLAVVAAPRGYGKTFLLAQWAAEHRGAPSAWLELDSTDDYATRLARRLVGALETLAPDLGRAALECRRDSDTSLGEAFLAQLVAELAALPEAILVIDDLSAVTNPTLVGELTALIEQAPATFHVVASGRSRTSLPGDGWPDGDVVALHATDLAFDKVEAGTLLRHVSGRGLTDAQVELLLARTEGWPAGLQLAAVALRSQQDVGACIEQFAGDHRHVAAYLRQEVVALQPDPVRRFLLDTAVLLELSAPLCDSVTGRHDAAEMLLQLEEQGLFVERLKTGWLRYHGLFRDLLRHDLRAVEPTAEPRLLRRAGEWHLGRGDVKRAAAYFFEAHDWDRVLELVDRHARSMFEANEPAVVVRWLDAVPPSFRSERHLRLQRAVSHAVVGNRHVSHQVLRELERQPMSAGERTVANMIRATGVQWHVPPLMAIEAADDVLAVLPSLAAEEIPAIFGFTTPVALRLAAAGSRARAMWLLGQVDEARKLFTALAGEPETHPLHLIDVLGALALLEAWSGHLLRAEQAAALAFQLAARDGLVGDPATTDAYLAMAAVLRERNQLGPASLTVDDALARAAPVRRAVSLAIAAGERALLHLAASEPERGIEEIRGFRAAGGAEPPGSVDTRLTAAEVRLLLAAGAPGRANDVLQAYGGLWNAELSSAALQAAIISRDLDVARHRLAQWPDDGERQSHLDRELWTAVLDDLEGRRRQSLQGMAHVVAVAAHEGHARLFLDAGDDVLRVLKALGRVDPTDHLRQLVEPAAPEPPERAALGDTLSDREMEVLRFLPTRLSGAEIADALYVSLNTLKTHLRSIYRKLGVTRRDEAIEAAERLNLV